MSKDLSAKYYQNNKKRLQKKFREKYWSLSKEEKERKWQYWRERNIDISEDEKQELAEHRKKYKIWKNKNASQINTDWRLLILKHNLKWKL